MLVRSAGFRFGLLYAGLFGISALAMALFLWWSTAGLLQRQTDAAIEADVENLVANYREGGITQVQETIEERLQQDVADVDSYLLIDAHGVILAGNLPWWPEEATPSVGSFMYKINRAGARLEAQLRQVVLPGGFRLLVGRDILVVHQVAHLLTGALLWGALIVAVLAVVGALTVRSLFRIAVANVSATAAAIGAGDLARRVRLSGRGDEFDTLAETINDMLDRIGRLMDGVRQVSNAIAHDLRTPIARARARLEDAARNAGSEAELRAALDRAVADLDGVVRVFEALLRIAEIESGARRQAFRPIDLAPLLGDLAELYEAAAEEGQHLLVRRIGERLPAFGDREMVQQAVANLLDNALKFSPPGSPVLLAGQVGPEGATVTVADHGPGIPPPDLAHATERFFRGESARSTPGAGLGLALVHAVAFLHGGALRLEDNQPGLRAVLIFPPAPAEPRGAGRVEQTSSAPKAAPSLVHS